MSRPLRPSTSTNLLLLAATLAPGVCAQTPVESGARLERYRDHVGMAAESRFARLHWQFLGPTNISGRVTDVAVAEPRGKTYTMYVAGASGGVWKTDNDGHSWTPVFEHAASTSIGDVTIAPSDPDVVWIGTGEANIFRSSMAGCGVYKSTDAGKTWKHMGLTKTHTIPRIVVHPRDADTVYVAASGHEWTDNPERGVYKTTDGGKTWTKVLFVNDKTGCIDLVMDPSNNDVLYAATWQRIRKRWNDPRNEDGYDGSGIYKTTDGGKTWNAINAGLPDARWRGRIGLDLCRSKPNVVYCFVDDYELSSGTAGNRDAYGRQRGRQIKGAEVYRSDNGGTQWRKVSPSNRFMRRHSGTYGWVFGQIRVDPNDPDVIYTMGLGLNVSRDGGKTFETLRGMHGDHHALWIDPGNSKFLVNGNDGGANASYDGGKTWTLFTRKLPMVQFFNVAFDMDEPFRVYGSIQDHGSRRAVVDVSRGRNRIPAQEWERAPGGEGSNQAIDPTNPDLVYSAGFYGSLTRTDLSQGRRGVRIVPRAPRGEEPYRGQWLAPFLLSPHNPGVIYLGLNYLFRSLDYGDTFERISDDLSYNDPDKKRDIPYQTLFAISESPRKMGLIYAGTDDGRLHVTRNGGADWIEITKGLAENRWIARVVASKYSEGLVYVAQNGKRWDDFTPYLWRSTDYGTTWKSIVGNIPLGPINVIREDPKNDKVLYVGTDVGVYVSTNAGESWDVLGSGLPSTFVSDLVVHPRDDILVISTHGRGMYAMDVRPIQGPATVEASGERQGGQRRRPRR